MTVTLNCLQQDVDNNYFNIVKIVVREKMQRNTDELLTFIFDSIGEIAKLNDNKKLLQALAKMGRDIIFADARKR